MTYCDTGLLPRMVLGCFCCVGKTVTDYSTYTSMAGAKGHEARRHNNILAGQRDPLRPWGSPRLKPKEDGVSWREKALGWGTLWESVHLQQMLEAAQNKQVKIKPQKDSQSPCLKFLQTEDYRVTISKVWEIVSFVVYPTTMKPIISVTATPQTEA